MLSTLSGMLFDTGAVGIAVALAVSTGAVVALLRLLRAPPTARDPVAAVRRAGGQIRGARDIQEDDLGFIDGATLDPGGEHPVAVVADGMGGHVNGDVASRHAVRAFITAYAGTGHVRDRLRAALNRANQAIASAVQEDPARDGMGATLVAAALTTDGLEWISVGDSPLFLYRDGILKRLNEDHSMAPVIAALREVDSSAADGMNPHELRSALVGREISKIDASPMPELLRLDDLVLLASDGLATLDEYETAGIIERSRGGGPEAVRDALLAAVEACADPTQDNVSIAVLEAPGASSKSA